MKISKILPVTLLASTFALTSISCGDQKKVAENRADQMNQDSREAMDDTRQMAEDTKDDMDDTMQNSQEMVANEKDAMEEEAMNEMDEVTDAMGGMEKMVGGAMMSPNETIVANASKANNLTTLVAAVEAADLVQTLQGDGPFTVFAPTNDAFNSLPSGTVETLLEPENKTMLQDILKYHVVAGKMNAKDVIAAINSGNGKAEFATVNGAMLTAMLDGDKVVLEDEDGNTATITTADVDQSNGVVHVINTVLMPKKN
ncbi:fasciclin domain-containing protein [Flavimarina sp. Hel_I_48]|uniref:fasciclin domain-containing protein n=1 Tax=Flavimarina sp. Hel_I_48 TaxID=1392488 RepID=UPI00056D69B8|nr:fasciclin domain-containing protein [Flavimarina sp. Hel_I_48]